MSYRFDGAHYKPSVDYYRLARQIERVKAVMGDGQWRSVAQIHDLLPHDPENSIQAQLRNLRKKSE